MKYTAILTAAIALAISASLATSDVHAQALYGSIVGTVSDSTDAAVPGATVTIVHTQTNQTRTVTTSGSGTFSFPTIPSGTYTVSFSLPGFRTVTREGVAVSISDVVRVDSRLQVDTITENVMVSGQAVTLQTDRAQVQSQLNTTSLEEMPVPPNRNYQNLLITIPGFTPPSNAHSISANPSRALNFNVNGASRNSNVVRIEGAAAPNVWLPHVSAYVPGLEAIETVNVVTSSFDADQGLAGGSAINLQMKSGTNNLHGSVFTFHGNEAMKSRPYFLPANEEKPKFMDNQSGGTVGGPIKRNKLFYFISYDGQFDRRTGHDFLTVPTAAMRAGDFSGSTTPIYDPATGNADGTGRTAFPGNRIPQNRFDPIALKILANIPLPTEAGVLTDNYFATGDFSVTRNKYDGKLTYTHSTNLIVNGRVGLLQYDMQNPPAFGDVGPGVHSAGGREGHGFGSTFNGTVSANYIVSPTFVVDTHFGFTRLDTAAEPPRMDENVGREILGIPGTNGATGERVYGGYPSFSVSNFANFGKQSSPIYYLDPAYRVRRECQLDQGQPQRAVWPERRPADDGQLRSPGRRIVLVQRRIDDASRRTHVESVQQLRRLSAGVRLFRQPQHSARRSRDEPDVAVQPCRRRSLAGVAETDVVVRRALGLLPDGRCKGSRLLEVRLGEQQDAALRRRRHSQGLRRENSAR